MTFVNKFLLRAPSAIPGVPLSHVLTYNFSNGGSISVIAGALAFIFPDYGFRDMSLSANQRWIRTGEKVENGLITPRSIHRTICWVKMHAEERNGRKTSHVLKILSFSSDKSKITFRSVCDLPSHRESWLPTARQKADGWSPDRGPVVRQSKPITFRSAPLRRDLKRFPAESGAGSSSVLLQFRSAAFASHRFKSSSFKFLLISSY